MVQYLNDFHAFAKYSIGREYPVDNALASTSEMILENVELMTGVPVFCDPNRIKGYDKKILPFHQPSPFDFAQVIAGEFEDMIYERLSSFEDANTIVVHKLMFTYGLNNPDDCKVHICYTII